MTTTIHKRERIIKNGRNRAKRAKTFKTEQAAQEYAKKNGVTKFTITNLQPFATQGKFRIDE